MPEPDRLEVATALRAALDRFVTLVRGLDPGDRHRPVPALPGWDVGDAVAHVLTVLRRGTGDMRRSATAAETAALNQTCLDEVAERDLAALADLVATEGAAAFANLDLLPVDLAFPFHGGTMSTVVPVSCVVVGELLVHGRDIATACDRDWPLADGEAALVLAGMAALMPAWRRADAEPGSVALRLDGLDLVIGDGPSTHVVEGRPADVLLAFPYGRVDVDDPGLLALAAAHQPV
ncbi:MAG TPA: maleylpyruvate isomerase family mycothiol-dependent enzyme [Iamia sp.]